MPVTAPPDPYREALERLYGLERGNKGPFGLAGTRALLDDLGRPEEAFRSIHVAGTNGKGSTSAFLERVLRGIGWRTGLFTSPHLLDFRERIRIDGRSAAPASVAQGLARIASVPAGSGRTFFEATFALGALAFAEAKVGVAVLETGLGGRLDSTNVVTPSLSVITPIGLDHQEMLGDTLEAIAGEKAGIIKPGIPVLAGRQDPAARSVLEARARAVSAPFHRAEDLVRVEAVHAIDSTGSDVTLALGDLGSRRMKLRMVGRHQAENAALAAAALLLFEPRVTGDALAEGLSEARWPGRFEPCPLHPRVWWDGAHNPPGAAMLRATWKEVLRDAPATLVLGVSEDKDVDGMLAALAGPWVRVYAVRARMPRAMDDRHLAGRVASAWPRADVVAAGDVASALQRALADDELVLACGSLFVVGEAMAACGAADLEQL